MKSYVNLTQSPVINIKHQYLKRDITVEIRES